MTIYVNMTDKAMSGWGEARGGFSYYCVACDTWDQAEAIEKAAHDRKEMIRIATSDKPRYGHGHTRIRHFDELGDVWKGYYKPSVAA
jgi:hypothetical protein